MQGHGAKLTGGGKLARWGAVAVMALLAGGCVARAQPGTREPQVGYVYPAGGRQGTTFQVTIGGQDLRGADRVLLSGDGVRAIVVEYARGLSNKQLGDIAQNLRALARQKAAEEAGRPAEGRRARGDKEAREELPELPDHPLVRGLAHKSLLELADLRDLLFNPKRQPNAQIADWAVVQVTIAPGAPIGDRELRVTTPGGISNPLCFQVGSFPELCEREPTRADPGPPPPAAVPVVFNGQITPGDVDRFAIRALRGQKLVIRVRARHLRPYLADAVPGWFQATLALYDAAGKELAFADDYRGDPDPVLLFDVPQDGDYALQIADALYRGREDFVYRIHVNEQPFITGIFPLGGTEGTKALVSATGWNLPTGQVELDTRPGQGVLRRASWSWGRETSNALSYVVDTLPQVDEQEPNDGPDRAQLAALPQAVNGRIGRAGDVDVYRFEGRAGDQIVAEVLARRSGSPLDALLRLSDPSGREVALSDDCEDRSMGLITHHADPYLRVKLEQDGVYCVQVSDVQGHGGEEYGYRLRLGPPRPDFDLRVTPSGISVAPGRSAVVCVHALRRDGFDGDIELVATPAAAGFTLSGGLIPAGRSTAPMTLSAPPQWRGEPVSLGIDGRAEIGGKTVVRAAVPAEDMMQAFAYRHLVPAQQLIAAPITARRWQPAPALADAGPLRIPAGGVGYVTVVVAGRAAPQGLQVALVEPPEGVGLGGVAPTPGGLRVEVRADGEKAPPGLRGNLILQASMEAEGRAQAEGKAPRRLRVPLGVLPAVPFAVTGHNG